MTTLSAAYPETSSARPLLPAVTHGARIGLPWALRRLGFERVALPGRPLPERDRDIGGRI